MIPATTNATPKVAKYSNHINAASQSHSLWIFKFGVCGAAVADHSGVPAERPLRAARRSTAADTDAMLSVTAKRPLARLGAAAGLLARPPVPVTLALPGAAVLLLAAAQALLAVVLVRLLRLLLVQLGRLGDGLFDCFLFVPRLLFGGGGGGSVRESRYCLFLLAKRASGVAFAAARRLLWRLITRAVRLA